MAQALLTLRHGGLAKQGTEPISFGFVIGCFLRPIAKGCLAVAFMLNSKAVRLVSVVHFF